MSSKNKGYKTLPSDIKSKTLELGVPARTTKQQWDAINDSIKNASSNFPGMCIGCNKMSLNFAKLNQNYDITIYHGTTGINP
ncbi:hypothetical protein [Proteus mirabilis]|uniref:endonuclease toxin domain-containing protein n=1 Tax=Proteus mirabilis TaxID=584 RepID=UPI0034D3CED8